MTSLTDAPRAGFGESAHRNRLSSPANALFLGLFASQAGVLVLSPILVDVARDFGVSTAVAGQLRLAAVPLAVLVAVAVARSGRLPLRSVLSAGALLVVVGSVASAVAPSFALLALAQVPIWVGAAVLVAGGVAAAGSWGAAAERGRTTARALAGPPAAWIVGMPLIGAVSEMHWRLAFLVLPLPAAVLALAAFLARPTDEPVDRPDATFTLLLREPGVLAWASGEVLANAAWAGTLVFSGALFIDHHGASAKVTGFLLSLVAVAYLAGNQFAGRRTGANLRRALVRADLGAGVGVLLLWTVAPTIALTAVLFCAAATAAAARTLWGTSYGFLVSGERKLEAGAVRAVAMQLGYLTGSLLGGAALAIGGYALMGPVFAALFAAAALPHLCLTARACHGTRRLSLQPAGTAAAR
jgi:predicted MFS family arabinose efflux permease